MEKPIQNYVSRQILKNKTFLLLLIFPMLQLLNLQFIEDSEVKKILSDLIQALTAIIAAILMFISSSRLRSENDISTHGWSVISISLAFFAIGMISFLIVESVLKISPYPGISDIFFILFYPFVVVGLKYLPKEKISFAKKMNLFLDVSAFALVAAMFIWHFNLKILLNSLQTEPNTGVWMSLCYTIFDTILLLILFYWMVLKLDQGGQYVPLLLLVTGGFFLIAADLFQGYIATYTNFTSGSLVDLGWVMFSTLCAMAATNLSTSIGKSKAKEDYIHSDFVRNLWTVGLTYFWIGLAFFMLVWAFFNKQNVDTVVLLIGVVGAIIVAVTRQVRSVFEKTKLYEHLRKAHNELEQKVIERTAELQFRNDLLEQSERKFKGIFNSSFSFIGMLSKDGILIEINQTALDKISYKREDVIGKLFWETPWWSLSNKSRNIIKEAILKALLGNVFLSEVEYYNHDGIPLTMQLSIKPIFDKRGEVTILIPEGYDITEQKNAIDSLIKNEKKYRFLMENMNEALMQVDNDDRVVFVNKKFSELLGYKPEEIVGKIGYEILMDKGEQNTIIEMNKLRRQEIASQYEIRFNTKDGKKLDFLISGAPIFSDTNVVIGSIGVMTDITDRKMAERALIESERFNKILFESSRNPIVVMEAETGVYVNSNDAAVKIYKYNSREETIGKTPIDVSPEFQYDGTPSTVKAKFYIGECLKKGSIIFDWLHQRPNGELWDAEVHLMHFKLKNRDMMQFSLLDVTEKRQIQSKIENARKFVEYIINSLPSAIITIDSNLNVTQYNSSAEKFRTCSDSKAANIFERFANLKFASELLNKSVSEGLVVTDSKIIYDDESNSKVYDIKIIPLVGITDSGSIVVVDDVTNKKKMEQILIENEKMVSIAGLAAGMAHEINNPLGTIVQGCQNINRRVSVDLPKNIEVAERLAIDINVVNSYLKERQIQEIIDSMMKAATKAAEIIRNMLQFSRKSESKRVKYPIDKLIDEVIELTYNDYGLKKKYDMRSIKIIRDYEPGIPEIPITVTEIQQVLFNLIQNAAHALRLENDPDKQPTLIFRLRRKGAYLSIEVEDNGPGIPEKIRKRVFEPFFTTKNVGEGTGLGLSVSYMIVKNNHNGNIVVNSQLGKGTVFTVELPLERGRHEENKSINS